MKFIFIKIDKYIYRADKTDRVFPIQVIILLFLMFSSGCKKLVEVDAPITGSNARNVYQGDATAAAVLTGIFTKMSSSDISSGSVNSLSFLLALSADELNLYDLSNPTYLQYFRNQLTNTTGSNFWISFYQDLFVVNSAIEGLDASNTLTPAVKKQLLGEAKFLRGFYYFYLVNLFGDVPLVLKTDYTVNSTLKRNTVSDVWRQIISDLTDAQDLLSEKYLQADVSNITTERVRPTKAAAKTLLARAYLYTGDFVRAEEQASSIINNSNVYALSSLNDAFLKNNIEAIWQLQPVGMGINTQDARLFVLPTSGPSFSNPVYLSNSLISSFETEDLRKQNWLGSVVVGNATYYYPYKYKAAVAGSPVTEYLTVFRLAELYLIRAEARLQQNKIDEAKADLNIIRTRANLPKTTANDKSSLLSAVWHERQMELYTEWGNRWLDLKRTKKIDDIMSNISPQKGSSWDSNWALFPIPLSELKTAPNIIQNIGY